ncbi:hypothetical protein AK830_g4283 [Neonectria ditissima]|uniref:Protein bimA n=1 Tax=Neonectria ditissima TaxID=78410 RepID=A0A0P7AWD4_9HYPO|nr:hypothetical protein AK830_g4283 [Neonectria ditissima]
MEETGLRVVYRQLDNDLNENALFLLDRLHALEPDNASWVHLRSLCCLRLGRFASACDYSREKGISGDHLGCSYVFSQSCLFQKRYAEGIRALEQAQRQGSCMGHSGDQQVSERFIPDSASVNRLLGKLHRANGDLKNAVTCFVAALELDPFMWDIFADLCDCGIPVNVPNVFRLGPTSSIKEHNRPLLTVADGNLGLPTRSDIGNASIPVPADRNSQSTLREIPKPQSGMGAPPPMKRKQRSALEMPTAETGGFNPDASRKDDPSSATSAVSQRRSARLNQATSSTVLTERSTIESNVRGDLFKRRGIQRTFIHPAPRKTSTLDQKMKSARSFSSSATRDANTGTGLTTSRAAGTDRAPDPFLEMATPLDQDKVRLLLGIFSKLGTAYHYLRRFQPQACLDALTSLPVEQQATAWVISKTARAQYEMLAYRDAKSTFQVLRKIAPSWIEDLEVYSIVLWHLNDDVTLAFHAHELTDSHFLSPQAWCAIGNSFSLQRAHTDAIKCFQRATQLQPQLAHSYTLLGHEYTDLEQYDEANTAFRRALQVDGRHYTAWVGLGRVQEKLGKLDLALKNYSNAEKINPTNGVLLTHIAKLHDKLGNPRLGLSCVQRAAKLDLPEKPAAFIKLQTARLYLRLDLPREALRELRLAEKIAPDESNVHFLLGKAYSMSGGEYKGNALRCFTIALSLNPRNDAIRDALSSLDED